MKSIIFKILAIFIFIGCSTSKYDYTIHEPEKKYSKPTKKALSLLLKRQLGKKYVWAEEGPDEFDCSGLTYYCYGSMNMKIPRVARDQIMVGEKVSCKNLEYGDLIFFDTSKKFTGKVTHVGIYIGNGKFEHASNEKNGVKISSLYSGYYSKRILGCRRYLTKDIKRGSDGRFHPPRLTKSKKISKFPKSIKTEEPKYDPNGQYYIQLGSFSKQPDEIYLQSIKSTGYNYKIVSKNGSHKLLIGPFSRDRAMKLLPIIQQAFNPRAFLIDIKNI